MHRNKTIADRLHQFVEENTVTDDFGGEISPLNDDYGFFKNELESISNPLSDDYCKYDNE